MAGAFYNENDPFAAAWLRNLAAANMIAPGRVDERSIEVVAPSDIGDGQAHFFAGIGGWQYALRLAGWPDDLPVWTGSCPCQPFSQASPDAAGFADERHLWPIWFRLIRECRPAVVFGEQVGSPDGLKWLDLVSADLEDAGYAFGAADLCAAGLGAPHIRQRLWFVGIRRDWLADDDDDARRGFFRRRGISGVELASCRRDVDGRGEDGVDVADTQRSGSGARRTGGANGRSTLEPDRHGAVGRAVDDASGVGRARCTAAGRQEGARPEHRGLLGDAYGVGGREGPGGAGGDGEIVGYDGDLGRETGVALGDAGLDGDREHARELRSDEGQHEERSANGRHASEPPGATGHWANAEWIACSDGKSRPVEPGSFPLAHGVPGRVGLLRGYGNAIVPQVAATFIRAVMDYLRG